MVLIPRWSEWQWCGDKKREGGGVASRSGEPVCLSLRAVGWEDVSPLHSHNQKQNMRIPHSQPREKGWMVSAVHCTGNDASVKWPLLYPSSGLSEGFDVHLVQDSSAQQLKAIWDHA